MLSREMLGRDVSMGLLFLLLSLSGTAGLAPISSAKSAPTALRLGEVTQGAIKGYGWKYYTVSVGRPSFLDVVVVLNRTGSVNGEVGFEADSNEEEYEEEDDDTVEDTSCAGWYVYLDVDEHKPEPQGRFIEKEALDMFQIVANAMIHSMQQSILCKMFSSAKVGIKHAEPKLWWIQVQTRGGTTAYDNVTCQYSIFVDTHTLPSFTIYGVCAAAVFVAWMLVWYGTTLRGMARLRTPSTSVPSFLFRAPGWAMLWLGGYLLPLLARKATAAVSRLLSWCRLRAHPEGDQESMIGPVRELQSVASHARETPVPVADASEDIPICRICREPSTTANPLVRPCGCQGSISHVHSACLNRWREESITMGRRENAVRCEICQQEFHFVRSRPSLISHGLALTWHCVVGLASRVGWVLCYIAAVYLTVWLLQGVLALW
eukprot:RCo030071